MNFYQTKYKILLIRAEFSTYNLVMVKFVNPKSPIIKIDNKSFVIDFTTPSYVFKNVKSYLVDIESGAQIQFTKTTPSLNPIDLDTIVSSKIIKELASGVLDNKKDKIMVFILGAIFGGMLAALLLMSYYNNQIQTIYQNFPLPTIGGF